MSNSKLVNYTQFSPNHSGLRTHSIDRITPHCVVGQLSVESLGSVFVNPGREASSNYGIGSDGRVGMYVEEKNRSWCSSSNANDQRAVTIECASDIKSPYAFNAAVYNKLIDLCVDICKRNGKTKLLFLGSLSKTNRYSPKSNEMMLTAHRWFAATECPGDWMYSRLDDLAETVTRKLSKSKTASPSSKPSEVLPDVFYRVKTKVSGWLPQVRNLEDYAGIQGQAVTGFMVKASKGSVKYRAHIKGDSWLPWVIGYSAGDSVNGFAGDFREIDAIEIIYKAPGGKKYKAKYRTAPVSGSYFDWQYNNEKTNGQDGYAGLFGKAISRIQITLIKGE